MDISILKRKNFEPEDFIKSEKAKMEGIDNGVYYQDVLDSLCITADKIQEVRDLLEQPIKVSSAYRCLQLNRMIGSQDTSQHLKGQAIDFTCPKFGSPQVIVDFLKYKKVEVDQILMEGSWIHLSIKKEGNRNEFAYYLPDKSGKRVKVLIK